MAQEMGHGPQDQADEEPHGRLGRFREAVRLAQEHPSNADHHARTLFRLAAFHVQANILRQRVRCPLGDHSMIWAERAFPSTAKAVVGNPPDYGDMVAWRGFLGPDTLFVDIGANAGVYSVWAADLGADVISVEPDAAALAALRANAALNSYEFEIVPAALFAGEGVMSFTEGLGPENHVLPGDAPAPSGHAVQTTTLDQVLGDRVAHGVKIDVEGAERFVLDGAHRALAEGRLRVIQLEYNSKARIYGETRLPLRDMLAEYGYSFLRPDHDGNLVPGRIGRGGGHDVFAVLS
jgi:FkbM family methyltransferase